MSENKKQQQTKERRPHLVKTIGKTTYLVTCHFSETSWETLQDKLKRMFRFNLQFACQERNRPLKDCFLTVRKRQHYHFFHVHYLSYPLH